MSSSPTMPGGYGHPTTSPPQRCGQSFLCRQRPAQFPRPAAVSTGEIILRHSSAGIMKIAVRLMPLLGQNPHKFGRNKDIDLTKCSMSNIRPCCRPLKNKSLEIRDEASACHASQGGGRPHPGPFRIFRLIDGLRGQRITSCGITLRHRQTP